MPFDQQPAAGLLQSLPDQKVWGAFREGNKGALEFVYRRYITDLYNYGMKIKGHECLVKDCIQELFVELWHSRVHLASTNNIRFYLLKALKLKIHHHLKKELRYDDHETAQSLSSEELVLPHESYLIHHQLKEEQKQKLYQGIKQLPARQREILHLLFFVELSYEEVSEIMGINVRSVYTLAWKSLAALRKKLIDFLFLLISGWVVMLIL